VLEHKSDSISEMCKDSGKVTMEGLYELTNALLNGTAYRRQKMGASYGTNY